MAYENILLATSDSVATITVNRPKVLNALNHQTLTVLAHGFVAVREDPRVRALVVTGSGD